LHVEAGGATLAEGQTVEFKVGPGRQRERAMNVRPV
jgi:cold shock CspA family protein